MRVIGTMNRAISVETSLNTVVRSGAATLEVLSCRKPTYQAKKSRSHGKARIPPTTVTTIPSIMAASNRCHHCARGAPSGVVGPCGRHW
jgi:hypothetical protein